MFRFYYNDLDVAHKLNESTLPSDNFERHMHPFIEILYFVNGNVKYTVEDKSKDLMPNDLLVIPSGRYHFAEVDKSVDYDRYVIKLPINILPKYIVNKINNCNIFMGVDTKLTSYFNNLSDYYKFYNEEDFYYLAIAEITKMLIYILNKNNNIVVNSYNEDISKIVDFIDKNLDKNINLDVIASTFNFSKSYLASEFKKYMKTSIMQYVRYKKVLAAYELILKGEKKSYVAKKFGFNDYSTFYRTYKKIIG